MIKIEEVTEYRGSDYERKINEIICEKTKRGWKFIDIKHSIAAHNGNLYSALLLFDDSPSTDDIPTPLNQ